MGQIGEYERLISTLPFEWNQRFEGYLALPPNHQYKEVSADYGTSITAGERSGFIGPGVQIGSAASPNFVQA
jgi:hypothetical protein